LNDKLNQVLSVITKDWSTTEQIRYRCSLHWVTVYVILEKLRDQNLIEKDVRMIGIAENKEQRRVLFWRLKRKR